MAENVFVYPNQWTALINAINGGDTTAIATALNTIKTSIDSITTSLGSLSIDVEQDSTQWTNLLTSIDKGDMTATATALGNIKTSLDNIYTRLNSIGFDTTQWGNLVNAITNQSITVDLSNITSDVVSNESTVTPADTVTEALDVLKSDLSKFDILVENYTTTTDTNGNVAIEGYTNMKILNFAWDSSHIFIPFFFNGKWFCRVQLTDATGTAIRNTSVTFNFFYTKAQ